MFHKNLHSAAKPAAQIVVKVYFYQIKHIIKCPFWKYKKRNEIEKKYPEQKKKYTLWK